MTKLKHIYKIIGENLILEKYGVTSENIDTINIKKKQLFDDIKSGLLKLRTTEYLSENEYEAMLDTIKSNLKESTSFSDAIMPFMLAAISSRTVDTSGD
jgi:hypothetical protein